MTNVAVPRNADALNEAILAAMGQPLPQIEAAVTAFGEDVQRMRESLDLRGNDDGSPLAYVAETGRYYRDGREYTPGSSDNSQPGSERPRASVDSTGAAKRKRNRTPQEIIAACLEATAKAEAMGIQFDSKNKLAAAINGSASTRALRAFWKAYSQTLPGEGASKTKTMRQTFEAESNEADPLDALIAAEEANGDSRIRR